eukprot:2049158-Prymnesium_polylepis.2
MGEECVRTLWSRGDHIRVQPSSATARRTPCRRVGGGLLELAVLRCQLPHITTCGGAARLIAGLSAERRRAVPIAPSPGAQSCCPPEQRRPKSSVPQGALVPLGAKGQTGHETYKLRRMQSLAAKR